MRQPLLEPILFLVLSVSDDSNVIVRDWKRLDYASPVNVILALVLASVNGTILLHANDAKVDLNVSAIFLFWMDIVRNALRLIVPAILHFVPPVTLSISAIVTVIFIKLTNHNPCR